MDTHYSREKLAEVAGGDEDFMTVVAQTFLEEIPPDLQALEDAVENNNKELAYQFAHKMKPNFEMFGSWLRKRHYPNRIMDPFFKKHQCGERPNGTRSLYCKNGVRRTEKRLFTLNASRNHYHRR